MTLNVLSVASEVFPLIKTGGLADVAGALGGALAPFDVAVLTLMPAYRSLRPLLESATEVARFDDLFGATGSVHAVRHAGLDLLLLDAPTLFDRDGGPYTSVGGFDHADNWKRFAALSLVAARIGRGAIRDYRPDVVHVHDWQAALAPVYIAMGPRPRPKTVLTIHNLAFQGNYPRAIFPELRLPPEAWSIEGVEYYGNVGYLKGGIHAADRVTTVSPTYAREILTPTGGMGLDGLLRGRGSAVSGIVNGIDVDAWNPETDDALAAPFSAASLDARAANRRALLAEFDLDAEEAGPVIGIVSRLTWQKGLDLVAEVADRIVEKGVRLVVIGTGEAMIEGAFEALRVRYPNRVGVRIAYDEGLSHRLQAGADAILIPSRFEPCGLTQLYGLRYGCIPIVARVGGLADTVIDANYAARKRGVGTGIIFDEPTTGSLMSAIERCLDLHADREAWTAMQESAMSSDVSWTASARLYADLYRDLTEDKTP